MNKYVYLLTSIFLMISNFGYAQVSISGKVVRHNGDPVGGVTVSCTAASPIVTGVDGSFEFSDLPEGEDYVLSANHSTDVFEDVTVLDYFYSRQLILWAVDQDPFRILPADISQNGALSTIDLVLLSKMIVLEDVGAPQFNWSFYNSELNGNNVQNGVLLENLASDTTGIQLVGTKFGDNAIDTDHIPPPPSASQPVFYVEEMSATIGTEITIDVKGIDLRQIAGWQHTVNWDPEILSFVELQSLDDPYHVYSNAAFEEQGMLPIIGGYINPLNDDLMPEDNTTIYQLKYFVLQNIDDLQEVFDISENLIPLQTVYYENGELYLVEQTFQFGEPITNTHTISNLDIFDLYPNPTLTETRVEIQFSNSTLATLSLLDINGKQLNAWAINAPNYVQNIDISGLAAGTYVLKLRTREGVQTKRIVKF